MAAAASAASAAATKGPRARHNRWTGLRYHARPTLAGRGAGAWPRAPPSVGSRRARPSRRQLASGCGCPPSLAAQDCGNAHSKGGLARGLALQCGAKGGSLVSIVSRLFGAQRQKWIQSLACQPRPPAFSGPTLARRKRMSSHATASRPINSPERARSKLLGRQQWRLWWAERAGRLPPWAGASLEAGGRAASVGAAGAGAGGPARALLRRIMSSRLSLMRPLARLCCCCCCCRCCCCCCCWPLWCMAAEWWRTGC